MQSLFFTDSAGFFLVVIGRDKYFEHVKTYQLSFSVDGKTWTKYKEKGKLRVSETATVYSFGEDFCFGAERVNFSKF